MPERCDYRGSPASRSEPSDVSERRRTLKIARLAPDRRHRHQLAAHSRDTASRLTTQTHHALSARAAAQLQKAGSGSTPCSFPFLMATFLSKLVLRHLRSAESFFQ